MDSLHPDGVTTYARPRDGGEVPEEFDPDILHRAEQPPLPPEPSPEPVPPMPPPEMEALQQMLNETINRLLAALAENVLLRRRLQAGG